MSIWIKINEDWGEYKWLCVDTGIEVLKLGVPISGKGKRLTYEDKEMKEHEVKLTNIKTGEILNPITNQHEKSKRSKNN